MDLHILFIKIHCRECARPSAENNLCSARNIRVKAVKCIWRAKVMVHVDSYAKISNTLLCGFKMRREIMLSTEQQYI